MTSQSIIKTVADTIHANGNGKIPMEECQQLAQELQEKGLLRYALPEPDVTAAGNHRWIGDEMPLVAVIDGAVCQMFPNGAEVVSDPRHSLHWGKCLIAASEEVLS